MRRGEIARPKASKRSSTWDEAGRLLGRRPRTVAELRGALAERGHDTTDIEQTVQLLVERGWLDDARLALDFIVARSKRAGHGRDRLLRDLERRGVDRATADRAWRDAVDSAQIDPEASLERQLKRRLAGRARLGRRDWARVYNAMLRAGFEAASIRRALEPHRDPSSTVDDPGNDDALA